MPTPTIQSQAVLQNSSNGWVDLYKFDASSLGGSIYYFSPQCYQDGTLLSFGGQSYNCFPLGIQTLQTHATTSALPRPQITLSNVNGTLMAAIANENDLVGAIITYWRTKEQYCDAGSTPDSTQFYGPQQWKIIQKTDHSNISVTWDLAIPLDVPNLMFPIRQVLKNSGINPGTQSVYFPGVQPYQTQ